MTIENTLASLRDPLIRDALRLAVFQTLLPAATEKAYPGHFTVTADGRTFGEENTWPGLDSWQLAGAYLLLDRPRLVRDYLAFVRAAQRKDGHIPFAIFPGDREPPGCNECLRGLHWPEDIYEYEPAGGPRRRWIGLFDHWQFLANPFAVLGPVSHLLTAAEYFAATGDGVWLKDNLPSLEAAARYVLSRRDDNGLIGASGFYLECPPRNRWDGVAQCYVSKAFRDLAALQTASGRASAAAIWTRLADALTEAFRREFWCDDHFAEYIHPDHGRVDVHGLSDVNWAAIALGLATDEQCRCLWPLLTTEPAFWDGQMPTQLVTKPRTYAEWELIEPLPFTWPQGPLYDVAAMGRVWWLEAQACLRMKAWDRLRESVLLVCQTGLRHGGWWYERYHLQDDHTVTPAGPKGYCEYAAILARVVLGNPEVFT